MATLADVEGSLTKGISTFSLFSAASGVTTAADSSGVGSGSGSSGAGGHRRPGFGRFGRGRQRLPQRGRRPHQPHRQRHLHPGQHRIAARWRRLGRAAVAQRAGRRRDRHPRESGRARLAPDVHRPAAARSVGGQRFAAAAFERFVDGHPQHGDRRRERCDQGRRHIAPAAHFGLASPTLPTLPVTTPTLPSASGTPTVTSSGGSTTVSVPTPSVPATRRHHHHGRRRLGRVSTPAAPLRAPRSTFPSEAGPLGIVGSGVGSGPRPGTHEEVPWSG